MHILTVCACCICREPRGRGYDFLCQLGGVNKLPRALNSSLNMEVREKRKDYFILLDPHAPLTCFWTTWNWSDICSSLVTTLFYFFIITSNLISHCGRPNSRQRTHLHTAPWSTHVAARSDYELDSAGQNRRRKSFKNTVIKKESSPVWASRPLAGSLGQHTVQPILSTKS